MKKSYIIIALTIIVIILGIIVGFAIANNNSVANLQKQLDSKLIESNNELSNEIEIVSTYSKEEKTTPNTLLIFKTYYKECKHTIEIKQNISAELVNFTEDEISKEYKEWQIEKFSKEEIVLVKEKEGICNEHYIIRDKDGYVSIYALDNDKNNEKKEVLIEVTKIVTSYLPQTDQLALKNGIKVTGKDKLNAILEDYE